MKRMALVLAVVLAGALAPLPSLAATAHTVTLDEHQLGKTVTVHKGDHIRLVLHSTYWTIDPAHNKGPGKPLATSGAQTTKGTGKPCSPPGSGCGTATRTFVAQATGDGWLTASRTTCGEALRCTGSQGRYRVNIHVVR